MSSFDIIFAGGGAAACITAGRLAAADPSLKILVLEAGPHVQNVESIQQPGYFPVNMNNPEFMNFFQAQPSSALANRSLPLSTGRVVGGGSSINAMIYNRAAASDYDDWEAYGNQGEPVQQAETWQEDTTNETHGSSGPLKISYAKGNNNVGVDFLETAINYDKERGMTEDTNDFSTVNMYGRWARYIDKETGKRSGTASNYIYNQASNSNLTVWAKKYVLRVIVENNAAVGVEYVDAETASLPEGMPSSPIIARAKLVVVSAGAFGSPAILERSGIGSASLLERLGIPQVVDLPGVGESYKDHEVLFTPYFTSEDADTLDAVVYGSPGQLKAFQEEWKKYGTGLLATNAADAGIKLRPNEEELKALSPAFDSVWNDFFKEKPDKAPVFMCSICVYIGQDDEVRGAKVVSMGYVVLYPRSSGTTHITSGTNPYAPLDIHTGFLEDVRLSDVVLLRWAYKKSREIIRRSKFYQGEVASGHPVFPVGSRAAATKQTSPSPVDAADLVYTPEDDEAIDLHIRQNVQSSWHGLGTCAMKPREQGGVVDSRLNVYGIRGLKVADLSVLPVNVGANTYNTAIAVGEKAAVIIAEELGITLGGIKLPQQGGL